MLQIIGPIIHKRNTPHVVPGVSTSQLSNPRVAEICILSHSWVMAYITNVDITHEGAADEEKAEMNMHTISRCILHLQAV